MTPARWSRTLKIARSDFLRDSAASRLFQDKVNRSFQARNKRDCRLTKDDGHMVELIRPDPRHANRRHASCDLAGGAGRSDDGAHRETHNAEPIGQRLSGRVRQTYLVWSGAANRPAA